MKRVDVENRAGLSRATCGWKKPALPLEVVRRYWRDVHSPAIARRAGVYDYRHYQFDAVDPRSFGHLPRVVVNAPADAQLMWLSDVRYLDEAALAAFGNSPAGEAKAKLLADIELIVERSTTYRSVGRNAWTFVDRMQQAIPQGVPVEPAYGLFLRAAAPEAVFRERLIDLADEWARVAGVLRLRLSLFDVPDMEAERRAGYPVKTHPVEQQYQAWIDLVVDDPGVLARLHARRGGPEIGSFVSVLHAQRVAHRYTFNYAGLPTLVGLRGYAASCAIHELGGHNHRDVALLSWMYGDVVGTGPAAEPAE